MVFFLNVAEIPLLSVNDIEETSAVIEDKKGWILRRVLTLPRSCQTFSPFGAWNLLFKYQLLKYPSAAVFPLIVSFPCEGKSRKNTGCVG